MNLSFSLHFHKIPKTCEVVYVSLGLFLHILLKFELCWVVAFVVRDRKTKKSSVYVKLYRCVWWWTFRKTQLNHFATFVVGASLSRHVKCAWSFVKISDPAADAWRHNFVYYAITSLISLTMRVASAYVRVCCNIYAIFAFIPLGENFGFWNLLFLQDGVKIGIHAICQCAI